MLEKIIISKKDLFMRLDDPRIISFLNPYSYIRLRSSQDLDFSSVTNWCIDGVLMARIFEFFSGTPTERISFDFTSLAGPIFEYALSRGKSIAFVGSDDKSISTFCGLIKENYPGINVVYCNSGYFDGAAGRRSVIQRIAEIHPDILVVGMGAVLQERFLIECRNAGWIGIGFTCGGFFHQTAKHGKEYYPRWVNSLNIRSFYRMWDEPKLLSRYFLYYPYAVLMLLVDLAFMKRKGLL